MSTGNSALALTFFQESDRAGTPVDMCAAGFTARFPGLPAMNLSVYEQFVAMFHAPFSNLTHPIDEVVEEGGTVAVRLRFEGVHTGDFMGVPASGRHISVEAAAFLHIAGGKVAEFWAFLDQTRLMQQISGDPPASPVQT